MQPSGRALDSWLAQAFKCGHLDRFAFWLDYVLIFNSLDYFSVLRNTLHIRRLISDFLSMYALIMWPIKWLSATESVLAGLCSLHSHSWHCGLLLSQTCLQFPGWKPERMQTGASRLQCSSSRWITSLLAFTQNKLSLLSTSFITSKQWLMPFPAPVFSHYLWLILPTLPVTNFEILLLSRCPD